MSINYLSVTQADVDGAYSDTDEFLVIDESSGSPKLKRLAGTILRAAIGGSGGGGGGGQVIQWDGFASQQAKSFTLVNGVGWPNYSDFPLYGLGSYLTYGQSSPNTLSSDGTQMILAAKESAPGANDAQVLQCIATASGQMPGTGGKFWMVLDLTQSEGSTSPSCTLDFALFQAWGLSMFQFHWDTVANTISYSFYAGGGHTTATPIALATGATKLLITFDTDTANFTVYDSDGQKAQGQYPGLTGAYWNTAAMMFLGQAYNVDATFTLNTTNAADSPWPVDTEDYAPWPVYSAVAPTTLSPGDFVSSTTASNMDGYEMAPGSVYLLMTDNALFSIYQQSDIVSIVQNTPLQLAQQLVIQGMGFASDSSNLIVGNSNGAWWTWVSNRQLAQSSPPNDSHGNPVTSAPGFNNLAVGVFALTSITHSADYNTSLGNGAGQQLVTGDNNVFVGGVVGQQLTSAQDYIAIGYAAGAVAGYTPLQSVSLGGSSMQLNNPSTPMTGGLPDDTKFVSIPGVVAIGYSAYSFNSFDVFTDPDTGVQGFSNTNAGHDIAIGWQAIQNSTLDNGSNIGIGMNAGSSSYMAYGNVALGESALYNSGDFGTTACDSSTAIGTWAMQSCGAMVNCTAVGAYAMNGTADANNSTAIGYQAVIDGDNQVQLGNSITTTYAYGQVQDRSDIRDKTDVRDTVLGLDFIKALRPVDFRWDMREDYIDRSTIPTPPPPLRAPPEPPTVSPSDKTYPQLQAQYKGALASWNIEKTQHAKAQAAHRAAVADWQKKNSMSTITHDGSKARKRFHHGVIAQEVKASADKLGVDFGGYQDHSHKGGQDIKSIGYGEFVGPLIKSVQELSAQQDQFAQQQSNPVYVDMIARRVLDLLRDEGWIIQPKVGDLSSS